MLNVDCTLYSCFETSLPASWYKKGALDIPPDRFHKPALRWVHRGRGFLTFRDVRSSSGEVPPVQCMGGYFFLSYHDDYVRIDFL